MGKIIDFNKYCSEKFENLRNYLFLSDDDDDEYMYIAYADSEYAPMSMLSDQYGIDSHIVLRGEKRKSPNKVRVSIAKIPKKDKNNMLHAIDDYNGFFVSDNPDRFLDWIKPINELENRTTSVEQFIEYVGGNQVKMEFFVVPELGRYLVNDIYIDEFRKSQLVSIEYTHNGEDFWLYSFKDRKGNLHIMEDFEEWSMDEIDDDLIKKHELYKWGGIEISNCHDTYESIVNEDSNIADFLRLIIRLIEDDTLILSENLEHFKGKYIDEILLSGFHVG